jgi:Zn-dependent M28 family amino/carboxypeptidase
MQSRDPGLVNSQAAVHNHRRRIMAEDFLDQVSADRIREHIRLLGGVRHPVTTPDALRQAADYIYASFNALNYRVEPHFFSEGGTEFRNIIATRLGVGHPEERLLIVAHYDTVEDSPGADDNASGVAVLLELARVLELVEFDRTVQFVAVNLEERQKEGPLIEAGLVGSRALAADAEKQGWKIEGVIVLETIAYAGEQIVQKAPDGLPFKLPEFGDFIAVVGNEASRGLVEAFVQAVGLRQIPLPVVPLVVPGNGEVVPDTRRSDHAPFWDRGYKAVMVTDTANFRNPNYHRPTDTLETLNMSFAAEVCRAVAAVVVDVAK